MVWRYSASSRVLKINLLNLNLEVPMKRFVYIACFALISTPAFASKPCEELKGEIAAKIEAKGVKTYTLEVMPADQVGDKKVVGSCEGGTKKIVYAKQ